jgi:hypothetical protein
VLACHLQQVGADRGQPVPGGDALVGLQACEQVKPGPRPTGHGHGDRVVQRHYRVV